MKLFKILSILLCTCCTSLFFFPFEFDALPGLNTKKILAVIGLLFLGYNLSRQKSGMIQKEIFLLFGCAALVSLIGLCSITLNNTPDYSYASYIMSMWVWLSAAYAVCSIVKMTHRKISFYHVTNYLIAVCVLQCFLALFIDSNESLKMIIDNYINQGEDFLNSSNVKRLYGIGASLDVAGSRFAVVLVLITYINLNSNQFSSRSYQPLYLASFLIIAIVGNMIARTTTVGLILALCYWIINLNRQWHELKGNYKYIAYSIIVIALIIPITVYLYDNVPSIHKNLRFAFEGFFSLAETGEWSVASNDKLRTMYVFPDNLKTWIIGDGYFSSPRDIDPYFIKKIVGGYYMGTDVGYLRFIFYFGLSGLIAFSTLIYYAYRICAQKFPIYKNLFLLFLLINFIVWFKVATDIFLVFALFITMESEEEEEENSKENTVYEIQEQKQ